MRMIIFFTIFTLVFGSVGYYIYHRISQAFSGTFLTSKYFLVIYILLISSFIIAKVLENYQVNIFTQALSQIGAYSLGIFFYVLIALVFIDILRLVNHFLPFFPAFIREHWAENRLMVGSAVASVILMVSLYGMWNAWQPRVKTVDLEIAKKVEGLESLNVVAFSDTHFGHTVGHGKAKRLIREVNKLNPDLVMIAGDMVDDNIEAVKSHQLYEYFRELSPRFGIYSIMGNHEYIGRAYTDIPYYEMNNIRMLIDSTALVDNKFYIVGRDDIQGEYFRQAKRKSLGDLTRDIDHAKPVFLLDHQPYALDLTAQAGVDLQFSGHTHHGQFWPFSYITGRIFEKDWGYLKKGDTHIYVSCGYGTAGPPMRIGSHPEIVQFRIRFTGNKPD